MRFSIEHLCIAADEEDWGLLTGCSATTNARRLRQELREMGATRVASPSRSSAAIRRAWGPLLTMLQFGIVHVADLSLICQGGRGETPALFWRDLQDVGNGTLVLNVLSTNLANTLICFRTTLLNGFPAQARVLLRSFVEFSELTLAVAADRDLYCKYFQVMENEHQTYLHWRKHLTPSRVRNLLKEIGTRKGVPSELNGRIDAWRQHVYAGLSAYSHASWAAQFLSAFTPDTRRKKMRQWSLGGVVTVESILPLIDAAYAIGLWNIQMTNFLGREEHGWSAFDLDRDYMRAWFIYRGEIIKRHFLLTAQLIPSAQDAALAWAPV